MSHLQRELRAITHPRMVQRCLFDAASAMFSKCHRRLCYPHGRTISGQHAYKFGIARGFRPSPSYAI
jgi:hypothetical protein